MNKKICIVYVCTGKYDIFFEEFYESSEKFFMLNYEKNYFVWTDSELKSFDKPNVVKIYQEKLGWPLDTLMRFNMFNGKRDELSEFDYIFFFNANMKILKEIKYDEIIPNEQDNWLVGVEHPGYPNNPGPLEKNIKSTAYIEPKLGNQYYQGCLFGGTSNAFIKMIEELNTNINIDLENDIIAEVWDESHLNKYFIKNKPKKLEIKYAFPDNYDSIKHTINGNYLGEKICIQLDKSKFGGHNQLRY